jgi:glutathione S-transferase
MPDVPLPILYTFRRCPYAIRARLSIAVSGVSVEYREIALRNKPQAMLLISPKGTVPVLQLADGRVIDQSLDIMLWALALNDPQQWLQGEKSLPESAKALIDTNDGPFKFWLDRYKYADRHPEQSAEHYRQQAEEFLQSLERLLEVREYLLGEHLSIADMAIFPFIRQFAAGCAAGIGFVRGGDGQARWLGTAGQRAVRRLYLLQLQARKSRLNLPKTPIPAIAEPNNQNAAGSGTGDGGPPCTIKLIRANVLVLKERLSTLTNSSFPMNRTSDELKPSVVTDASISAPRMSTIAALSNRKM